MRYLLPIVLLTLLVAGECAELAVDELIAHELNFAKTAREEGTHKAFLAFLGEGSIVFRPLPVDAVKWYETNPDNGGLLSWHPVYAEVSAAGDLGFTTGPWEFRAQPRQEPRAFGQFVSIWKRHSDGNWKVVLDAGIFHPEHPAGEQNRTIEKQQAKRTQKTPESENELLQIEKRLNEETGKSGLEVLAPHFAAGSFLLRNGSFPTRGSKAIAEHLANTEGVWIFSCSGAGASKDGTLGYTYGTYEVTERAAEKGSYLRIWRMEDDWKIALDLVAPAPET